MTPFLTPFRRFGIAYSFLTSLPTFGRGRSIPNRTDLGGSLFFYPVIGALIGLLLAGLYLLLQRFLPMPLVAFFVMIAWALITGGLHIDGVADSCDAFFSSRNREEMLRILKDSHIGTMGTIGIVGILIGKVVALSLVASPLTALIASCVLGRWAAVLAAATSGYARAEGGLASGILEWKPSRIVFASLWLALFLLLPDGMFALQAAAAVACFVLIARYFFYRRIGGLTGDCLGAIIEASELIVLCAFV